MDRRSAAIEGPVWPLVALNVYVYVYINLTSTVQDFDMTKFCIAIFEVLDHLKQQKYHR